MTYLSSKVKGHGTVGNLHIGNLDNNLLELIVVPVGESLHHSQRSVVGFIYICALGFSPALKYDGKLTVDNVEENKLRPEVSLFGGLDDLGLQQC